MRIIVLILIPFIIFSCQEKRESKFKIYITSTSEILLNNKSIDLNTLEEQIERYIRREKANSFIVLNAAETLKYRDYIELKGVLDKKIKHLREKLAIEMYNKEYEDLNEKQLKEIYNVYPGNIIHEGVLSN